MSRYGPTIGEALKHDGLKPDPERVRIFKAIVRDRIEEYLQGKEVSDPLKTFVKPEPHKEKKLSEGRYRLIMAVSMEDTMIDRMLYGGFYERAVDTFTETPCKVGYNPVFGGYRYIAGLFSGRKVLMCDKKAWDMSVRKWLTDFWEQFIMDLLPRAPAWWVTLHKMRFKSLFGPDTLFKFTDGSLATQRRWGVMKSGCYLTLLLNSVGQRVLQVLACLRLGLPIGTMACVGDDTVEDVPEDLEAYLLEIAALGAVVKEFAVSESIEFCGFKISHTAAVPKYEDKHRYTLHNLYDAETQEQVCLAYLMMYSQYPEMYAEVERFYEYQTGLQAPPRALQEAYWNGDLDSQLSSSARLVLYEDVPAA